MPGSMPSAPPAGADNWDRHWHTVGEYARGNPANRYRHRLIFRHLGPCGGGARIVDIGSGQGEFACLLQARFRCAQVWGIEHSAVGVSLAEAAAMRQGLAIRFTQRDLLSSTEDSAAQDSPTEASATEASATEHPSAGDGWATHAVCSEVLEHVDHPAVLLRHARRYMAPDCRLVVTVPAGPRSGFDRHIGHRRHFTPQSLRHTLDEAGFTTSRVERAGAPFFNLYRLAVMMGSRRLIDKFARSERSRSELSRSGAPKPSTGIDFACRIVDVAFRFNLPSTPFGWQLVAVATPTSV